MYPAHKNLLYCVAVQSLEAQQAKKKNLDQRERFGYDPANVRLFLFSPLWMLALCTL